ncbi:MAG: hypothetical protein ISEC1_P1430 [Thiomicrorhabdus sp.]|nr:MAG: hypothetical protein ISEC1_P1430 [Thiomicrorhabdus sp.]
MVLALLIQCLALCLLFLGVSIAPYFIEPPYFAVLLVAAQGGLAALLTYRLGLPYWWRWIQFLMPLGLYAGILLAFDPVWALLILVLVWLFFSNAITERVPLYFTNATTRYALKELVKTKRSVHFVDLGCGFASNVIFMSKQDEVAVSHGVETAPFPYLLSKLRTILFGGQTFAQDIWKTDLANYDVVYAFLSPEPMEKLWDKVSHEMNAGSLFISNSFAVPSIDPSEVWELADKRRTKLYIYRL